jgi:cell wall-associated NlpC family hydrolase
MAANRTGLTSFVNSKVGGNYVWGGTGNGGYDCSGLTYKAYESQGVSIPRVAQDQYNASTKISTDQLQAGDLVFFSDTGSKNNVTHVGMYIGNGMYTHAANSSRGIVTDKLNTNGSYFVGAGTFAGTGGATVGTSTILKPSQGGLTYQQFLGLSDIGKTTGTGASSGGTILKPSQGGLTYQEFLAQNGGVAAVPVDDLSWKEKILVLLGHIVKALTLMGVFALAAVFFTKAFDIKLVKTGGLV